MSSRSWWSCADRLDSCIAAESCRAGIPKRRSGVCQHIDISPVRALSTYGRTATRFVAAANKLHFHTVSVAFVLIYSLLSLRFKTSTRRSRHERCTTQGARCRARQITIVFGLTRAYYCIGEHDPFAARSSEAYSHKRDSRCPARFG